MPWKIDLAFVGGGMVIGGALGGAIVGARRLSKHIADNTPDAPVDYVTMLGSEFNEHFHVLKKFVEGKEEKSFLKTLRHRLSRLIKLSYNTDDRLKDTTFWKRLAVIPERSAEVHKLINTVQYLVKERHGNNPILGFDEAILSLRQVVDDINHNNILQGRDID